MALPEGVKKVIFKALPKSLIFAMKRMQLKQREQPDYDEWIRTKQAPPAPHKYKQELIREYARKYELKTLVETGTFVGLMMDAQLSHFQRLFSIELDRDLFRAALKRFKKHPHVTILQGDSGEIMERIAPEFKEPVLFWLDGHYSGGFTAMGKSECPINGELKSILSLPVDHVILIDDARCFNGTHDYPTLSELETFVTKLKAGMTVRTENDVIRIEPVK